ncbi:MAG: glycosyltransferase family 2 protein, partial [Gemmatimonadales bacterium]|nr:glycosyltransferase family 2 protein [Gemmatimonadales bacterium]
MPPRADAGRLAPVRVVDLELTVPVGTLTGLERYVELQALVRRHGVPLGWMALPVTGGEVSREAIQAAVDARWMRSSGPERVAPAPLPSVTVAVCTRDRPDDLARCLDALVRLDLPAVELLVVDNAPTNDRGERVVRGRHPRVRYVREPEPGLDHARNRAIVEATGEILAFTDDDVVVDPAWARALAEAFAGDPEVVAVTGLVVPWELETDAQVLFERYRSFARGFVPGRVKMDPSTGSMGWRYGNTGRFGTGANMAFRREVFGRVGPFDPALGPGTISRGGDDLEMLFRLLKAGGALRYEPRAVVRHRHRRE